MVLSRLAVRFEVAQESHSRQFSIPPVQFDLGRLDTDRVVGWLETPTGSKSLSARQKAAARGDCGCFFVRVSLPHFGISSIAVETTELVRLESPWPYRLT